MLPIQVGIDVAGPGEDETVLVARCGRGDSGTPCVPGADPARARRAGAGRLKHTGRLLRWSWTRWALATTSRCTLPTTASRCRIQRRPSGHRRRTLCEREGRSVLGSSRMDGTGRSAGSMISKRRRSFPRSSTGRRRRAKPKSRARRTPGSAGSPRPIAPRRWSWRSAGSCRANRHSFSTSAS